MTEEVYDTPEAAIEAARAALEADVAEAGKPAPDQPDDAPEVTEPSAAESAEEVPEEPPAKGSSTAYSKLLEKYGNDPEKLAEGIFEQYNSTARLYESSAQTNARVDELVELVQSLIAPPAPDPSEDAFVKDISDQIAAVDTDVQSIQSRQSRLVIQINEQNERVLGLRGQVKMATSPEEAERLTDRAESAAEKLQSLMDRYDELGDRVKEKERAKTYLGKQRELAINQHTARLQMAREQAVQVKAFEADSARQFWDSVVSECSARGIKDEGEIKKIHKSLAHEFKGLVSGLPDDADPIDLPKWVGESMTSRHGARSDKFKERSQARNAVTPPRGKPATSSKSLVPPNFSKLPLDKRLEIAQAHINRNLGGG